MSDSIAQVVERATSLFNESVTQVLEQARLVQLHVACIHRQDCRGRQGQPRVVAVKEFTPRPPPLTTMIGSVREWAPESAAPDNLKKYSLF